MFIDFTRTTSNGYFRTLPALLILCVDTKTDRARTYGLLPDPMLAQQMAHVLGKDGTQPRPDNLPTLGRLASDLGRHAALTYEGESTRVRLVVTDMVCATYEGFSERETRATTDPENVRYIFDKPAPNAEPRFWLDVTDHYLNPEVDVPQYWWVRHPDTGALVLQGKFQSAENPKAEDAVAVPALREAENAALLAVWREREKVSTGYAKQVECWGCKTLALRGDLIGPVHNQCRVCGQGVLGIEARHLQVGSRFNRLKGGEWLVTVKRGGKQTVLATCVEGKYEGQQIELGFDVTVYPV